MSRLRSACGVPGTAHTLFRCGPHGPLRGTLFTFEKRGAAFECRVQKDHRVVDDPAILHVGLREFRFRDGLAMLTVEQVAKLKALLRGASATAAD